MTDIFVYGTLMFDEVWNRVVAGEYEKSEACLSGYSRQYIVGEEYPAIVINNQQQVRGLVRFGVSPADVRLLDEFEGDYYQRTTTSVELSGNSFGPVDIYVLKSGYYHLLSGRVWDPAEFSRGGLVLFMQQYISCM